MHKAPSVSYPVGPCLWYERSVWLAWSLVCFAGLWVAAIRSVVGGAAVSFFIALALAMYVAVMIHVARQPQGRLSWCNEPLQPGEWLWQPKGARARLVTVNVVWRTNTCLGVRLRHEQGVIWVWVRASESPEDWVAFQRALVCAASSA
jgi:hypothetical protein